MNIAQIVARVMVRLTELGLSEGEVKRCAAVIAPAVTVVGGDVNKMINFSCECFAGKMKHD